MTQYILRIALLSIVWLLALGSLSFGDVLIGVLLSVGLLEVTGYRRTRVMAGSVARRIVAFGPFLIAVFRDIVVGTWEVALVVFGLREVQPGYVEVPIGERTTNGVAVTAMLVTLAPGSVLINVDWERRIMLYHMLDATSPDKVAATIDKFYEQYQRAVFP